MGFRRVQVLMMLLLLSGGFASGQAVANDDLDDAHTVSSFFPDVKPFVPAKREKFATASAHQSKAFHAVSKPHASRVVKSPKIKAFAAVKATSGFHPKSKAFVPTISHRYAAKKIHTAQNKPVLPHGKNKLKVTLSKNVVNKPVSTADNERAFTSLQPVKINLAVNTRAVNAVKSAASKLEMKSDIEGALQEKAVHAKQQALANTNKVVPLKVDAVVKARVDEKIQARNSKIDVITSAVVGVDPNKIDASKAIHSIFVSQPQKVKLTPAETGANVKSAKNSITNQKTDALIGAAAARQAMIDASEAGKTPAVKIVTADLSKNEFYILGESEPVPEHLKNNPETQMVVLGGEVDDAAKKIMEFKLAALNAARVRAAKELAEKQESAKALAELEIEEKEAMAKLVAAQKAVDDMQKLKKWQKEKENHIGTVVEKVAPEYKKAIVQTVVPKEIDKNTVAEKQEDKLVPIDQIALSAEKVADDLGHDGVIAHTNDTIAEVKIYPVLKPFAKKVVAKKKSKLSVERIAAKQLNDEIISIKSAKNKKTAKAFIKQKSEDAAVAPKTSMTNKKQKISVKHSAKKNAAIKLAKMKKPARP